MGDTKRFARELYRFRLATLGSAAFLLPLVVPLGWAEAIALAMMVPAALAWWSAASGWMGPGEHEGRVLGLASLLEVLAIAALVAAYGGAKSPFLLLFLPLGVQAAGALSPAGALLVAGYAAAAAWAAIGWGEGPQPTWTLIPVAAAALGAVALGWWAATRHRADARDRARARRLATLRGLMARALAQEDLERFWRSYLREVTTDGGYAGAAIIRWTGGEPRVSATDRPEAWRGLTARHAELLRRRLASGSPEVFLEEGAEPRAIVCWPVPRRRGAIGAAGLLCVLVGPRARRLADGGLDLGAVWRHLDRWLPLAGLALAASEPRPALRRASVDWTALVDAVVRRLDRRLAGHLVMVDVEPGEVAADPTLLADAVAHLVDEALDSVPPGSRVRLHARRQEGAWRFEVETTAPLDGASAAARPGLQLARRVVAAHGGRWENRTEKGIRYLGFTLPGR